jgi:hypothetical protein
MGSVLFATEYQVAKAEMLLPAHPGFNPKHHKDSVENMILLIFTDDVDKAQQIIVLHPKSDIVEDIKHCAMCGQVRLVAEHC